MERKDFIKLRQKIHDDFKLWFSYSRKHNCLYCDFVSSDCSNRIRKFLSGNYEQFSYFHFSDGSAFIE